MRLTAATVAVTAAAALLLAGCNSPDPPKTSLPKPSDVGLSERSPSTAAPAPDADVRFLTLLNVRNVPYYGMKPAHDAGVACSNLASGDTWDQAVAAAPFPDLIQRRWWVFTAVEVYCPQFG